MKSEKNILITFILNLSFSIFELIGGTITNSVAIISDAIHDMGDSLSIGLSYLLEKKSKKNPDNKYTYGYIRYSVIGSIVTTSILFIGSIFVIYSAFKRIMNPVEVNYNGMIFFALIGLMTNLLASYFTKGGESLNQRAINLHMIEDVLGWIVVLIGAFVMRFTNISIIDPILSILVAIFILINTIENFKEVLNIFFEKVPSNINIKELKKHLLEINGVLDIHHIHIWSIDGFHNYATMHVVANKNFEKIKNEIKEELKHHDIEHSTIELEKEEEKCTEKRCKIESNSKVHHHHHH